MLTRRTILASALPAALLAGCASTTPSQIATDVQLLASGLAPVVTSLATAAGVPAATVAQAQQYLSVVQTAAQQFAAGSVSAAASVAQDVVAAVRALASVAGAIPALAPYATVIQAATALLPVILAEAGVAVTGAAPSLPPEQARLILRAAAK